MARTYAQARTEVLRLRALGQKLVVRMVKNPILGEDAALFPGGPGTNDYFVQIKDPRGSAQGSLASTATQLQSAAITATRWHDALSRAASDADGPDRPEHVIRMLGLSKGSQAASAVSAAWRNYGAGESRESGVVTDSAVVFT